jgi:hypothetical protein
MTKQLWFARPIRQMSTWRNPTRSARPRAHIRESGSQRYWRRTRSVARALANRSRESRSVMWTPGSLSGGEALAFGSLAATAS